MNLHHAKTAYPVGFVDHHRVAYKLTHQGRWTVRLSGRRNEAEGGHLEHPWIMPSTIRHLPVVNQDRPFCHPQFTGTFTHE